MANSQDTRSNNQSSNKTGSKSGGNFANDPQRASEAGRKGGEASHKNS